jgi:hypothetical protein
VSETFVVAAGEGGRRKSPASGPLASSTLRANNERDVLGETVARILIKRYYGKAGVGRQARSGGVLQTLHVPHGSCELL